MSFFFLCLLHPSSPSRYLSLSIPLPLVYPLLALQVLVIRVSTSDMFFISWSWGM
jgi:hypothetical protein